MWVNINGNWIGRNRGGQKWSSYWKNRSPEYWKVYEAASVKPSQDIATAQGEFVKKLVDDGVWAKIACIIPYCAGMPDSADALTWWNDPTRTASLGGANPPTYTVGQGFTGTANGYIDTDFNPSVDGGALYTQNDCTNIWFFSNNRTTGADKGNGLVASGTGNPGIQLYPKYSDNNLYLRQQGAYSSILGGVHTNNMFSAVRLSSSQQQMYLNRTGLGLQNSTSVALANETVNDLCIKIIGGARSAFTDDTIALRIFAKGLDATDISNICNALDTLMLRISSSVLFEDACDGSVIDTDKWEIANSNVATATFEQNNELVMNSLQTGTAANEYYKNMISSKTYRAWGVWKFSVLSILKAGDYGYIQVGIRTSKTSDNWAVAFTNDISENISFVVKEGAWAANYSVANAFEYFAQIKMVVTPTRTIRAYKWVDDSWIQIGIDKEYNFSDLYLYMATRGWTPMKTSIRDVYITNFDYSTLNPV